MRISNTEKTRISFGKLSDPGVMSSISLGRGVVRPEAFESRQFQYIVDNIADMFGLRHGTVSAEVIDQDYQLGWLDRNGNNRIDPGEVVMQFTMNAAMRIYQRESFYGKNFMYQTARQYGAPVVFGIAAHEIGHLINLYTLNTVETKILKGHAVLVQTTQTAPRWDELCADYLAGIVLAKASPRLSQEPLKNFLRGTQEDSDHPDGFWRVYAVEMGYQWGSNNSQLLTGRIISDTNSLKQLLTGFFKTFYEKVYMGVPPSTRMQHSQLPNYLLTPAAIALGEL